MRSRFWFRSLLFAGLLLLPLPASAKRLIYIADDCVISMIEGWYRTNPKPGDVIVREADGKKLAADAWGLLASGDELVIGTHGQTQSSKVVGSLTLEGKIFSGFKVKGADSGGTGACFPTYDLPALNLDNLTVRFKVCFAGGVPAGPNRKSVQQSMIPCLTGKNITYEAYAVAVPVGFSPGWKSGDGKGTQDERDNAKYCLFQQAVRDGFDSTDAGSFRKWIDKKCYKDLVKVNDYLKNPPCMDSIDTWQMTFTFTDPTPAKPGMLEHPWREPVAPARLPRRRGIQAIPKSTVEEADGYSIDGCEEGQCALTPVTKTDWGRLRRTYR